MKPKVAITVVVPAYNEEKLIGHCLTSLKAQQFSYPFEIIVVDNNSTDKTAKVAASFGVKIVFEPHLSVVAARSRGLTTAQGDIIAGADSDCVYPPHWLALLYSHFQANPQVVAVGGPAEGEYDPWWGYLHYRLGFWLIEKVYHLTGYVFYLGGFNFAYRRQVFLKLGGYRTYLDFGGDEWEPLSRLRKVGKVIFDPRLKIHLSLRRYRVGLIKFLFVHSFYYYSLNYILANIFRRTIIHAKPVRNT